MTGSIQDMRRWLCTYQLTFSCIIPSSFHYPGFVSTLPTHLSRWKQNDDDETRVPSAVWWGLYSLFILFRLIFLFKAIPQFEYSDICWWYGRAYSPGWLPRVHLWCVQVGAVSVGELVQTVGLQANDGLPQFSYMAHPINQRTSASSSSRNQQCQSGLWEVMVMNDAWVRTSIRAHICHQESAQCLICNGAGSKSTSWMLRASDISKIWDTGHWRRTWGAGEQTRGWSVAQQ